MLDNECIMLAVYTVCIQIDQIENDYHSNLAVSLIDQSPKNVV